MSGFAGAIWSKKGYEMWSQSYYNPLSGCVDWTMLDNWFEMFADELLPCCWDAIVFELNK